MRPTLLTQGCQLLFESMPGWIGEILVLVSAPPTAWAESAPWHLSKPTYCKVWISRSAVRGDPSSTRSISTWRRPGHHDKGRWATRYAKSCHWQGRDLGFNTVLGFFSKLSSGTGGLKSKNASRTTHPQLTVPESERCPKEACRRFIGRDKQPTSGFDEASRS